MRRLIPSLFSLWFLAGCHVISPVETTRSAIGETFARIQLFFKSQGKIPPSLDILPSRPGYGNRTTDGWGRPLTYSISDEGVLTLSSLGRDGVKGGTGDDADFSISYRTIDSEGKSLMGDELWIVNAKTELSAPPATP